MPTSRTIADIKSNLLHPALTSHFEVTIPKPPGLSGTEGEKYLSPIMELYIIRIN
jgi:hypothetical protein